MALQIQTFTATSGVAVKLSFDASSTLARQIEQGAPADLFASADLDWMDYLASRNLIKPETARLMTKNHNPAGFTPRGLGFGVGKESGSPGCSEQTFGHTGSTGTLCWADSASETVCVVLTSLPRRAAKRHPREVAAERVAAAARRE